MEHVAIKTYSSCGRERARVHADERGSNSWAAAAAARRRAGYAPNMKQSCPGKKDIEQGTSVGVDSELNLVPVCFMCHVGYLIAFRIFVQ